MNRFMTPKQISQFNEMRAVLIRIARKYRSAQNILAGPASIGLSVEEELEMAYDNIQFDAERAVKGVREIKRHAAGIPATEATE